MLVLVVVAVLSTVAVAGAAVGGLLVGHRRAAAAADLAALAAAEALGGGGAATAAGGATACEQAGRLSEANGARLTGCQVEGRDVTIEVAVDVPSVLGGAWAVPGRARAGPAEGGATRSVGPDP
jgi:secretion/DNA translocation related TadE-like protein